MPSRGEQRIHLLNRTQMRVIATGLVLLTVLAVVPPWRYMDGGFAGFAPVFAPPPALPDSLVSGKVAVEYVEIKIVPTMMDQTLRRTDFTPEELAQPHLDVRRMLAAGAVIFLLVGITLIGLDLRARRAAAKVSVAPHDAPE